MPASFRPIFYLAAPYSHLKPTVREERFHLASRAAARLMEAGYSVISPLSMGVVIHRHGGDIGEDWETWKDVCLRLLERCDALCLLTLPGWRDSVGVMAELRYAETLGLPIHGVTTGAAPLLTPNIRWRDLS